MPPHFGGGIFKRHTSWLDSGGNNLNTVCIMNVFAVKHEIKNLHVAAWLFGQKLTIEKAVCLDCGGCGAKQRLCTPVADVNAGAGGQSSCHDRGVCGQVSLL